MRFIINESLLKKKNIGNLFRKEGKGGLSCSIWHSALQCLSGSFKVSHSEKKKTKQDHLFLTRYKEIKSIKTAGFKHVSKESEEIYAYMYM